MHGSGALILSRIQTWEEPLRAPERLVAGREMMQWSRLSLHGEDIAPHPPVAWMRMFRLYHVQTMFLLYFTRDTYRVGLAHSWKREFDLL